MLSETLRFAVPLVILSLGVGGFLAMGSRHPEPRVETDSALEPLVETVSVTPHDQGLDIEIDGTVVPARQIDLSAEVAGRIAKKTPECRAGTYITRGTPLLEIDPRDFELAVRRLQDELKQADVSLKELDVDLANTEAQIQLAEEELALQRKNLARLLDLAEKKVAAESEIDLARREELAARNALRSLQNQRDLWKPRRTRAEIARELVSVQLEKAQLDLSRTKIVAPIDGSIISDPVEADAFVDKGELLVTINDVSSAEVRCSLKMDDLYWLWKQQEPLGSLPRDEGLAARYEIPRTPVTVSYALEGNEYVWEGELSRFEGTGLDPKTRMVPCRVLVSSPREVSVVEPSGVTRRITTGPRSLVSGMYVTVRIHARPEATLLRIPARAVRPGNVVWRANGGKLSIKRVQVVEATRDNVILHAAGSGLEAGDAVIVSPLPVVTDGMPIREQAVP